MNLSPTVVNLALSAAAFTASLGIGEVVLRTFVSRPMRRVLPEIRYAPHPVRRFTLIPEQEAFSYGVPARIDARGFRTNRDGPRPEDTGPRLLALGDSFTFGLGVRSDQTWPAQLETRLASRATPGTQVTNAGTISYGVFQELDLLRSRGLTTRPKVVVHALYWNDYMNAEAPAADAAPVVDDNGYFVWDQLSTPRSGLQRLSSLATSSSALAFSLKQLSGTFRQSRPGQTGYAKAYQQFLTAGLTNAEWHPIAQFYRDLNRLASEQDFTPFTVIMPVSDLMTSEAPRSHPYPTAARRVLEEAGIPYLDAFALPPKVGIRRELFLPEGADAHLNSDGYAVIAEALADALLANPATSARIRPQ